MRLFTFVIHSHTCALCGILLHNKRDKKKILQMPLTGYLRRSKKQPISLFFAVFLDRALQSNTERIFIYLVLQVISKFLEREHALLLEF